MLNVFGDLYAQTSKHRIVEVAHMEIAQPTILQAVHKCVQRGATHVVIAPYFLSRGRHVQTDIPKQVEEAQSEVPLVPIHVADPIGSAPISDSGSAATLLQVALAFKRGWFTVVGSQKRTHLPRLQL
jgi:sirohydrochlorin ferrochelatase